MPRPTKWRRVASLPEVTYFKPRGVQLKFLEEVRVSVEEAEAIRLKDLEGLEQEQCAERMKISRPTFQRVLVSARQKIADALLDGKAIRIEGGKFEMVARHFRCTEGHEWEVPFESLIHSPPELCPECETGSFMPVSIPSSNRGRGRRHRIGKRNR
jgi:predicted DNA-binding protein (UPF0251 family)